MKKMLFICMVGSIFITGMATAGEVVSTNIVGYTQYGDSMSGRYTVLAPPFISVLNTDRELMLESITGNFDFFNAIQIFDGNAKVEFEAYWLPDWAAGADGEGWYDGDDWDLYLGKTPLSLGNAYYIVTDGGVKITVAGQVDTDEVEIKIKDRYACIGNSTHASLNLDEFEVEGLDFFNAIQIFDGNAKVEFEAYWLPDWAGAYGEGWYDGDDWDLYLGDKPIAPGQGFFLVTDGQPVTVKIPAFNL